MCGTAHNHPSGVAGPSHADELIRQRVKEALALMDIRLLDHIIIGDGASVSWWNVEFFNMWSKKYLGGLRSSRQTLPHH